MSPIASHLQNRFHRRDATLFAIESLKFVIAIILTGSFYMIGHTGYTKLCGLWSILIFASLIVFQFIKKPDISRYLLTFGTIGLSIYACYLAGGLLGAPSFYFIIFPIVFSCYSSFHQSLLFSSTLLIALCISWSAFGPGQWLLDTNNPTFELEMLLSFCTCFMLSFIGGSIFQFYVENLLIKNQRDQEDLEKAIKEKDELYKHLIATNKIADIGGWSLNTETEKLWWSDQTFAIHDLPVGDPADIKDAINFYAEEARPIIQQAINDGIQSGKGWSLELPFITAKNRQIWVHAAGEPSYDEYGTLILRGTFQDITARKKVTLELEETREIALQASQAKSSFLANMSHEIRTPMNGVLATADLLVEENLTEKQNKMVQTIIFSGQSMLHVLNDILDFSKIDAGNIQIDSHDFDLQNLMQSIIELFLPAANAKKICLNLNLDPAMPQYVHTDSTRLRQILMNLVNNAIKFTPRGAIAIDVEVLEDQETSCSLQFEVRDTGIGIPKEQRDAIFQEFSQADVSTTRKYGGTGLGLTICRELTNLLGSQLQLAENPPLGTRFFFVLQLQKVQTPAASKTKETIKKDFKNLSVLIAEDNAINLEIAQMHLQRLHINSDTACNGQEASQMVKQKNYDLVLMDCHMPIMDGYTATKEIRLMTLANQPKIIAMTANAMTGDREKCLQAGMDDYLSKPITKDDLMDMMSKWFTASE